MTMRSALVEFCNISSRQRKCLSVRLFWATSISSVIRPSRLSSAVARNGPILASNSDALKRLLRAFVIAISFYSCSLGFFEISGMTKTSEKRMRNFLSNAIMLCCSFSIVECELAIVNTRRVPLCWVKVIIIVQSLFDSDICAKFSILHFPRKTHCKKWKYSIQKVEYRIP